MNKIWAFLSLGLLANCSDSGKIYSADIEGFWHKNKIQRLEFDINDAQNPKNIIFVVKNNSDYPYSNLFLIANIRDNQQILKTDTLQYILAKPNGEWLGTGMGEVKEIWVQYKNNYTFPANGTYQIEVKHGMRTDSLKGIENIGIKIENINKTP